MGAAKETAPTEIVEAVVARGHTIYEAKDKPPRKAGQKIKLEAGEADRLRKLGFLVDPDAEEIPLQQVPKINPSDGPSVRLA